MIWYLLRIAAASVTTPDEPVTEVRPPQTAGAATSAVPQIRARLASTPKPDQDHGVAGDGRGGPATPPACRPAGSHCRRGPASRRRQAPGPRRLRRPGPTACASEPGLWCGGSAARLLAPALDLQALVRSTGQRRPPPTAGVACGRKRIGPTDDYGRTGRGARSARTARRTRPGGREDAIRDRRVAPTGGPPACLERRGWARKKFASVRSWCSSSARTSRSATRLPLLPRVG